MKNKLFKVVCKDHQLSDKYVCVIGCLDDNNVNVEELNLGGYTVEPSLAIDKKHLQSSDKTPLVWKAAYAVWRNNVLNNEFCYKKNSKKKKKIIELLAEKYSIDKNVLVSVIKELEDGGFF